MREDPYFEIEGTRGAWRWRLVDPMDIVITARGKVRWFQWRARLDVWWFRRQVRRAEMADRLDA